MPLSSKSLLRVILPVILVLTLTIGVISYNNNKAFDDTTYWLKHSYVVLDKSDDIYSMVMNIESNSNSYLFTNDSNSLASYRTSAKLVLRSIDSVKQLCFDNPIQQAHLDSLTTLVSRQISFTDKYIRLSGKNQFNATEQYDYVHKKRHNTDKINNLLYYIINEEERLLRQREAENEKTLSRFHFIFYTLLTSLFLLISAVTGLLVYIFSQQRKAEAKLKESQERLFKISNFSPIPTYIMELETGKIIYANAACEKLFSDRRENLIKKTLAEEGLTTIESHEELLNKLKDVKREGGNSIEIKVIMQDKEIRDILFSADAIEIDNKKCSLETMVDISEMKKQENIIRKALEREKELGEMKSRFVSFASHEFRTPLATIMTSTALVEKYQESKLDSMSRKHLTRIQLNVKTLIDLLNDFLSLGRLEEGKMESSPVDLDLINFSNEITENIKELAKDGQNIICEFSGTPETIKVDDKLLRNVLNNLLSNAIKYSPTGSDIYLKILFNSQHVSFIVKDNGIGIPEQDQVHLFERFFRANNATHLPGTGLGLNIVKRYLDIMNGTIEFFSKVNEGTSFVVRLPKSQ